MTINIGQFELNLAAKLGSSANTSDIQALATAKQYLRNGDINVVTQYSDLPSASSVTAGSLYFVENDGVVYIPAQNLFGSVVWRPLYDMEYSIAYAWGLGNTGRLGDGTTTDKSSPVSVVGGFTDWCQISGLQLNSAGVRTNGTLWTWGDNVTGQLGDGTVAAKCSPVSVLGGFTDWCQVTTGCRFSAAVRTNGTLWAWGCNAGGILGDGTTVCKSSPISIVGGFSDWCEVSSGYAHTLAIRTNGTLWAWGCNNLGRLGDGTTVNKCSPVSVVGGFTDWCNVSGGSALSAAIRTNGTLWTWGSATAGALGNNTTVSRSSPGSVVGGFTDWCQVSVGVGNVSAVRTNGTLWSWGCNVNGQLGDGTTVNKSSPVSVIGGFTNWCQVSTSTGFGASAVRTNGTIWSWGAGTSGQLGDGTVACKCSPVSVVGGFTDWCQVTRITTHAIGIRKKTF